MTALPAFDVTDGNTGAPELSSQYPEALIGVPNAGLRLTWRIPASSATEQLGYQLSRSENGIDWEDSTAVASSASIGIAVDDELPSRARRQFRVRIATEHGWTPWSFPLGVEAAMDAGEWRASVIGLQTTIEGPAVLLRTVFSVGESPIRARLRISSLGTHDVWMNGRPVSDEHFNPGWTSYQERITVATHDVTDALSIGENAIGIAIADGWFRGRIGFAHRTAVYGDRIGALAQLEIEYADGSVQTVATDGSWRAGTGRVTGTSLYDGTSIDERLTGVEFSTRDFDDATWAAAEEIADDLTRFEPRTTEPVRVIEQLPMTRRGTTGTYDAGQNISGWVRLEVTGRRGDIVTIRHAEVLTPDGELLTAPLRDAKATDTYVLATDGVSILEPAFTFHGFQYAEVSGDAVVISATAVAISSDTRPRATFTSSHGTLDQFHRNVVWSQRDNFVSIPTDCPQRDERLGWTGDAQVFASTATLLFDTESFWLSWLRDLEIDQTDEGGVPSVVPDIIRPQDLVMGGVPSDPLGRAAWADAATIVPFAVYEAYGSTQVLEQQLRSMRRWVEHLRRRAGDAIVLPEEPFQWGDWLDPDAPGDRPWAAKVDAVYVANALYVHSTRLLAQAEDLVGDAAAASEYRALADRVAAATWQRWGEASARTQTGAALALEYGLAPESERAGIAAALAADVREAGGRIATGFVGTALILSALSHAGFVAEAYLMLLRRDTPSWLYQVDRGATTVWERWDAIAPDGTIHTGQMDTKEGDVMISFNHYAYGAMIDWVYRNVAGISPTVDDPGYRTILVQPRPAAELTHAAASVDTRLGLVSIDWRIAGGDLHISLHVPFGSTAKLDLPVTDASVVTVNGGVATRELHHGEHRIVVTAPAIVPSLR